MRRLLQLLFESRLHLQLSSQLLTQAFIFLGKHIVALLLAQGESFEAGHLLSLLGSQDLVFCELLFELRNLCAQALIDDDALVQGLERGLQPFDFDILILSGDVSFIKLLVDFDIRK